MTTLPSRILIAGCGYVGRVLAEKLRDAGSHVLGLTRTAESASELDFPAQACDLTDPESLRRLDVSPEAIVHCASAGGGGAEAYEAVYHQGCRNLLDVFPRALLIFTSSTSVYPQTGGEIVTESSAAEPDSGTARILREAEDAVLSRGGIVARLSGIYGPGRSIYLKRLLNGTATIETGTSRFLNQIHRDDAAAALEFLLRHRHEASGQIYNITDDAHLTQRECFEKLARLLDCPLPPEAPPGPNRKRAWTNKRVSNEKLRTLGWSPQWPAFLDAVKDDPRLLP